MKYIFHFCRPYLRKVRGRLSLLIGLYIVVSLTGLVSPYIMGQFIDKLYEAESLAFIRNYIILLAALAIFEFFMSYICERLYIRVQIGSGYALNAEAIHHLQKVRFGFSQGQNAAFLNQQINNDANSAVIFCITILQNIVANVLSLLVPFVLILLFEPWLGLCMVVLNILYFILYNIFKKPVYQADYAFKEEQAAFFSKLNGQISDIQFIQAQGLADSFIRRLDRSVRGLLGKALHSQRASFGFTGSDGVIRTAASITVLLIGGAAVIEKRMTIGELTIVMSYFSMSLSATRYFFSLGKSIQTNRVSCDRLKRIFDVDEQTNGKEQLEDIETIECDGVSFAYGEEKILDNLSRSFRKGGIYAFVGENGSGKSTLINLLLGLFIDDYEGSVRYNGKPIEEIDMRSLRKRLVGVSEQEPMLLEESLRFNLTLEDDAELPEAEFSALASILNLNPYLDSLSEGLDTVIREGATNLSGGEKQKISIVRALLKHPKLLVLDEPTSALDNASRENLIAFLRETCADRIVLISTHDKALIDICTDIVSL